MNSRFYYEFIASGEDAGLFFSTVYGDRISSENENIVGRFHLSNNEPTRSPRTDQRQGGSMSHFIDVVCRRLKTWHLRCDHNAR